MNKKLHRILNEIQKTEEKIAAWQEHLGELNVQKEMLEDAEIIKSVRSMRLGSRELLAVLEGVQNGTVILSERPEMTDDSDIDGSTEPGNLSEITENTAETMGNRTDAAENTEEGFSVEQGLPEDAAAERKDF